jgi:hypothetical protein
MYPWGFALLRPRRLTEEELMQSAEMKGLGWRLAIGFAVFAVMVASLNLAYENKNDRLQAIAADRLESQSDAR